MRTLILLLLPLLVFGQARAQKSESSVVTLDGNKVANTKDRYLTVEVGDSTQAVFDPSFKISAWDGECEFRLNMSTADNPLGAATRVVGTINGKEKTTLMTPDVTHKLYVRADGAFEWEIVLPTKPSSNVLTYQIHTKGLKFSYQGELTQAEIDHNAIRPDSVVGSYAVYHNSKSNNRIIISGKDTSFENYGNGKFGHFFRAKAWDALGDTVWCAVDIDTAANLLSITRPMEFHNKANYPVIVGPTFGHIGQGASAVTTLNVVCHGVLWSADHYTASTGDNVDTLYGYLDGSDDAKLAVYDVSGGVPNNKTAESDFFSISGPGWYKIAVNIALSNGVIYSVAFGEMQTGLYYIYYDSETNAGSEYNGQNFPATWVNNSTYNTRYSLYAVYSTGAPAAVGQVIFINQ